MVSAWALGLFLAGLSIVAIELAYPRRYVGVLGIVLSVAGLVIGLPGERSTTLNASIVVVAGALALAIAIPFYRRYAPHVGPAQLPDVGAGSIGIVEADISPTQAGLVRAGGIVWTATADRPIPARARVRILVVEPDRLWVEADSGPTDPGDRDQHDDREARR